MENLEGKVAYITGGTKGIGYGIAETLLSAGMKVAISGRDTQNAKEVAKQLGTEERVLGLGSDVTEPEDEEKAVNAVLKKWGQLDVVIANAGVGIFKPVDELSTEEWRKMIDTNLNGPFFTLKASVDALRRSKGYYITIASLAGTNFFASGTGYNASKFGLVGFTQAAMLDLRTSDIKVSTIMPGSVATHFNNNIPDDKDSWKIQPEDIGLLVEDLLRMNPRTLPSKIEVRPTRPDKRNT
ncbi:MAG: SDR family oxidoreductase [Flavobacteriaceae bacterium]|nr:SDR family oxidoreductase [Muriicola sp.]NNC60779.1 SDR family oxidoreductase [Eudoraea sp.]NNK20752.1 SDR family oxidoreductase [Flavobacteriaceae bacterium]MBT8289450.1 SDR family oxidoreductase [Muriicola sp.]NNK34642.1 SDR family oxidoreductase [Eudoraea sp.]